MKLQHEFLVGAELNGVLPELITRTKALVSDLDHFQYRKMRKLIYLDEQQSTLTSDGVTVSEKHDAVCYSLIRTKKFGG
uniref:Uncharacterized protein n=1 Tax=Parascaris equorum TaxID=6256 RepID=A0A914RCW6_PAREQ